MIILSHAVILVNLFLLFYLTQSNFCDMVSSRLRR
nr:MAG TPA: hypothetical protein [Bacteriophage sp.]